MKNLLNFVLILAASTVFAQSAQTVIYVDQFGYRDNDKKVGVLSDPQVGYNEIMSYTPTGNIGLYSSASDQMLRSYAPISWNGGAVHTDSGDRGWWVDFSDWTVPGTFYLGEINGTVRSPDFEIKTTVYRPILKEALRSFYYNRCGIEKQAPYADAKWLDARSFNKPKQDVECAFVFDSTNPALIKDLSGGWFDAGDYNKYVTFAHSAVHNLLKAYEDDPLRFSDANNIPESGNGIPDIIDEVKYELDWLMKMNNSDGSTHIKMGSTDFDTNVESPPSLNDDPRYYGPTCSSASFSVAANFALASEIFREFNSTLLYADELEERAIISWDYANEYIINGNLETDCDDGTIVAGDADRDVEEQMSLAFIGAVYLFNLTQDQKYQDFIINNLANLPPIETGFWGPYEIPLIDALLDYTTFNNANQTVSNGIISSITEAVNNNWNGFFGFNSDDLYRAYMPDWSYHWGSNSTKASYGILNMLVEKFDIISGPVTSFEEMAQGQLNYFHGVNPQGVVYLSNMYHVGGDHCVNEIYHNWFENGTIYDNALTSPNGPAPGFVPGGPNRDFSINALSPPFGQPAQKSYLDYNDGWPLNSWEITEPAIYYQAAYVRLLSYFVEEEGTTWTVNEEVETLGVYPNPAREEIILDVQNMSGITISNILGQPVDNWIQNGNRINISNLSTGVFIIQLEEDGKNKVALFEIQ